MPKKISTRSVKERLRKLGIELLEDYKGMALRHKLRHPCGHETEQVLSNVLNAGIGCTQCSDQKKFKRLPTERLDERLDERLSSLRVELLEDYRGVARKHKLRHLDCGHETFQVLSNIFYKSVGCPICAATKHFSTPEASDSGR